MKTDDNQLYLLKKIHGWCKRHNNLEPEMYFQATFRNFLDSYGLLLTTIETRNHEYQGNHTFTFQIADKERFKFFLTDRFFIADLFFKHQRDFDFFEYEGIKLIKQSPNTITIRCYYPI